MLRLSRRRGEALEREGDALKKLRTAHEETKRLTAELATAQAAEQGACSLEAYAAWPKRARRASWPVGALTRVAGATSRAPQPLRRSTAL